VNKPTVKQFCLVLIVIFILYFFLHFVTSYFYVDNLIKNQIMFLTIVAAGNYTWQKLGFKTCMNISQMIILIAALFIITDVLVYLLHVNKILSIIVSLSIYLVGVHILRKQGYLKTECKINKND